MPRATPKDSANHCFAWFVIFGEVGQRDDKKVVSELCSKMKQELIRKGEAGQTSKQE